MKLKLFGILFLVTILLAGCGKENNGIQENDKKAETGAEPETKIEEGEAGQKEEAKKKEIWETGTEKEESEQGLKAGQEEGTEPTAEEEPESPANYSRESESGKVKFDCKIETPDSYTGDNVHKYLVSGECYGDEESILSKYVEGKEVAEQFSTEAHDGISSRNYYTMADGSIDNVGGIRTNLDSFNSGYYTRA